MGATQSHEGPNRAEPGSANFSAHETREPSALIAERYRLIARLHAGTGGVLYRAEDIAFARPVALRLLTPALSRDEAVLERLQSRLKASASMAREDLEASGDIIDLIDLGRAEDGLLFVVTELLTGDNLATLIARDGPMSWPALRPLMVRACQILHLSHQHGLLRLDLQTRHLFPVRDKTQTSTLKILSPGIGDVFGDSLWSSLEPRSAARQLRYAAPEQLTGDRVDARTDIYALGVIMYELLCGQAPFPDGRPAYVCARHLLDAPPPFPADLRKTIPREVIGIVERALAKAPAERWPTMRALANAMAAIDFGPCDLSGVLEVSAVQRPEPSGVTPSMRIDPAAGHAPSPAVRTRTLPPLRDAFMATPEASEMPTSAKVRAIDERAQTYERWFKGSSEPSPAAASGSASEMAWDEILAAAEEAVAAVASSSGSGTVGDSGVFTPERLLHSGEAATASTVRGRRPVLTRSRSPEPAPAASASGPRVELAEAAAASTTLQLDAEDLHGADDFAGDSAADLPLGSRAARDAPRPGESAAGLQEMSAHSAPVWMVSPTGTAPSPRSRGLSWAAGVILTLGAAAGGLRWLQPGTSVSPQLGVTAPRSTGPEAGPPRPSNPELEPPRRQKLSLRADPPVPFAVGALPGAPTGAPTDAPTGTAQTMSPPRDTAAPAEPVTLAPEQTAPSPLTLAPAAPPLAAPAAQGDPPLSTPMKRRSTAPAGERPALGPASDLLPAATPRKSLPGTRLPDAGHDDDASPSQAARQAPANSTHVAP